MDAIAISNANASASIEGGLKKEISRQVGMKNFQAQIGNHTLNCLVEMWKSYHDRTLGTSWIEELERQIWFFLNRNPQQFWVKLNSGLFGVKTRIAEYTNKQGKTSLAHFTAQGYYCGSVKKLGDKPVEYQGNFQITHKDFDLCLERLDRLEKQGGFYNITQLFKPKKDVVFFTAPPAPVEVPFEDEEDDDEKPLAPPPKKTAQKKK